MKFLTPHFGLEQLYPNKKWFYLYEIKPFFIYELKGVLIESSIWIR